MTVINPLNKEKETSRIKINEKSQNLKVKQILYNYIKKNVNQKDLELTVKGFKNELKCVLCSKNTTCIENISG